MATKDLRGFWKPPEIRTQTDDRKAAHIATKIRKRLKSKAPWVVKPDKSEAFWKCLAWRQLRYEVLKNTGARCQCCGATRKDGVQIHVDHIHPRKTHPQLALSIDNLQVLCEDCNAGKGSWDSTDWR